MDGASKILTVSYGTFSCTLEGFDDPILTMRSIAEYFRDLAAEDRYFGAEPPTPDADMLHQIAQKQVKAQVEAHVDDDGILLRQMTNTSGATTDQGEDADEPVAANKGKPASLGEAVYAEDELSDSASDEASEVDAASGSNAFSVAAKLSRIRAVVSGSDGEESSDLQFSGSIDEAFEDVEEADWEEVAELSGDAEPADDDAVAQIEAADDTQIEDEQFDAVSGDASDDLSEDEPVVEFQEDTEADEDSADDTDEVHVSDDVEEAKDSEGASELGLAARIVKLKRAAAKMSEREDFDATEAEPASEHSLSADEEEEFERELAAVEMEDSEFDLAADDEDSQEEDPVVSVLDVLDETPEDLEDNEDDEETDGMLAAIARATGLEDDGDDIQDDEAPSPELNRAERAQLSMAAQDNEDAALDRILEQTNSRMDDSEGSRRRSAIAHLKAAVAATKADRLLNGGSDAEADAEDEQSQYRDDLAQVVQPPSADINDEEDTAEFEDTEEDSGGAPLVLVSDQRVDESENPFDEEVDFSTPEASILSRQNMGTTSDFVVAEDETDFAEFAEKMGATELPDLLEAAAAYTAFVEGNRAFSRPQLMRRVAHYDAGNDDYSREAGLRSFGQLLRQGKIQKLRRGQFTIGEDTRFNPESRIAGE